jgi:hypothetical protein
MGAPLSYRIAAAVASGILLIGFFSTLMGFDPMSDVMRENRKRSPPPSASFSDWQAYVDQVNAYIGDNYGFRSSLIRGHALFRERVLNTNSADNIFLDAIGLDAE